MPRPFTDRQLARRRCLVCDAPATEQWRACADGSWRTLCTAHDVELNEIILRFFGLPDAEAQIVAYRASKLAPTT